MKKATSGRNVGSKYKMNVYLIKWMCLVVVIYQHHQLIININVMYGSYPHKITHMISSDQNMRVTLFKINNINGSYTHGMRNLNDWIVFKENTA